MSPTTSKTSVPFPRLPTGTSRSILRSASRCCEIGPSATDPSDDRLVASEGVQSIPGSLDKTLTELQATLTSMSADSELQARLLPTITELERTLGSLRKVLDTLDEQPNALIFNRKYRDDPRPPAGSQ